MFTTRDVVRISDRWFDHAHPDAISRQSRLQSCVVLVTVFHLVMSIAFAKIDEYERVHAPKRAVPSEFAFEFMIAPPELKHVKENPIPTPVNLIEDKENDNGGLAGAKRGGNKEAAILKKEQSIPVDTSKLSLDLQSQKQEKIAMQPLDIPSMQLHRMKEEQQQLSPAPVGSIVDESANPSTRGITNGGDGDEQEGDGPSSGRDADSHGYGESDVHSGSQMPVPAELQPTVGYNIAPYRKELLIRISKEWDPPTKKAVRVLLLLDIANDGRLISASVIDSSGGSKVERGALDAVRRTVFAPFPEELALLKQHLRFQIDLRNYTE